MNDLQAALRAAIENEGLRPDVHRAIMARHRHEWPTLWRAIDALLAASEPGAYGWRESCGYECPFTAEAHEKDERIGHAFEAARAEPGAGLRAALESIMRKSDPGVNVTDYRPPNDERGERLTAIYLVARSALEGSSE